MTVAKIKARLEALSEVKATVAGLNGERGASAVAENREKAKAQLEVIEYILNFIEEGK